MPLRRGYAMYLRRQGIALKQFLEVKPMCKREVIKVCYLFWEKVRYLLKFVVWTLWTNENDPWYDVHCNCQIKSRLPVKLCSWIQGLGIFYNNLTPFKLCNRIRLLVLTGSTDDIPLSVSASMAEEGSNHSAEVMEAESNDSDGHFM